MPNFWWMESFDEKTITVTLTDGTNTKEIKLESYSKITSLQTCYLSEFDKPSLISRIKRHLRGVFK